MPIHGLGKTAMQRLTDRRWANRRQPITGIAFRSSTQVTDLTHERTTMMMDFGGELFKQRNNRIGAHVNLTRGPERIWCYRC